MSAIDISFLEPHQFEKWDDYVQAHSEATFFHKSGWHRVIKNAFGHHPYYLWAIDKLTSEVKGVLPLFQVKSFLFGNALVSLPFCVYGGALAVNEDVRRQLEDFAASLAEKLQVDYLEIRNITQTRDDWPTKSLHATFIKDIASTEEENLALVKYKQRAVVRKALKNDLSVEFSDRVDEFYHAYSTSVRNLGTPVFSKRYFQELKREFGQDCEILSVKQHGQVHCALMSFYYKDTVYPYYGGGMPESRGSKAMDLMYFDQMCRAGKAGYTKYDFGRSKKDTGPFNYKRHWGFEPQNLHYQYHLVKAKELPDLNPLNPKYQLMVRTWQKLPLWLSQFIGPFVSRYLG